MTEAATPDPQQPVSVATPCPHCGTLMRPSVMRTVIWLNDRAHIIEDIDGQICDSCVEQFYDEDVTDALRRLMERGFPTSEAAREVTVPVFSMKGRVQPRRPATEEEMMADY